ncbi:MAG: acetyl-CoA carboxylase biotin carboxyl carrier protein [Treponemataceae bacterium]|nr:acetyl-CoA carboxylase biotin carboxyl carrier protein [Treponemataceae bacterium]
MTESFVFDLIEKFNDSSLVSLDYSYGDTHLFLKKKEAYGLASGTDSGTAATPKAVLPEKKEDNANHEAVEVLTADNKDGSEKVTSPIVGTFYRSPSPDSPAYAEKGMRIKKGDPLCIIEAMKMMNTLTAEYDMEIIDVLAENGALAEYGQPLFSVKRI